MRTQKESRLETCVLNQNFKSTLGLLGMILFFVFNLTSAFAQQSSAEIFHPRTTNRTTKTVKAYLPFHQNSKMVSVEFVDGMAVLEGDIVLGPSSLYSGDVTYAIAIDGDTYRWPNGIIPYTIESGHPKRQQIMQAIQHIQQRTSIRMISRSNQQDYVRFITGDGCWSRVGRVGGMQKINIGSCSTGSIIHEILHAAGMWHEQSRSDRDANVQIMWDNIKEDKKHNFKKHVSDGIDIGQYDCGSIMHYSSMAFSKNGQATIVGKTCNTLGQRSGMSPGDISGINSLYKPAVPQGLTSKLWYLKLKHSGKVVDIRGGGKSPKVNVQQYQLNHSEAQKFRFINAGGGYYYIQNVNSGMVLDVQGGVARAGTNVWQYNKNNTDAQKFRLQTAGGGYLFIRSKLGNFNLEVLGASKSNGANIRIGAIKGGPDQQFKLQEAKIAPTPKTSYLKPLEHYWNSSRRDNFSAASAKAKSNAVRGKYRFVRIDGYVLTKSTSLEGTTTPLYLYWNASRTDNFTTASAQGIRAAQAGGYRRASLEGYILKTVKPKYKNLYKPLWLYYHPTRKDNFTTASAAGIRAAQAGGYRKVRIEGYVRKDNTTNLATNLPTVFTRN